MRPSPFAASGVSTEFLLPPRLAEMFHARGETLTCYYFRASERDVYSAVSPGEPRLEDRLRRPKDMLRQRALSMHLLYLNSSSLLLGAHRQGAARGTS